MRLPFLRPKPDAEPSRPAAAKAERARKSAPEDGNLDVAAARTRARRRLVGALVLLVIGVVGFPVLFETTPRPLPLDTPFEVPRRDGAVSPPPSAMAPTRPLPVRNLPADAGSEARAAPAAASSVPESAVVSLRPAPAAPVPAAAPAPAPAPVPAQAAAARASAAAPTVRPTAAVVPAAVVATPAPRAAPAEPRASEAARARALLDGSASASAAAAGGRFVVQVGAYTDAATLREARAKVEKMGMKSYTQVIENDAGKRTRVRVGPYATRAEAEAAAAKVKKAGLPANVLTL